MLKVRACKRMYCTCLLVLLPLFSWAQEVTMEDYDRAVSFLWNNLNNKKVFNTHVSPNWTQNDEGFWYLHHEPGKKIFMTMAFDEQRAQPLFDHNNVAKQLEELTGKEIDPYDLPFNTLNEVDEKKASIQVGKKHFTIDLRSGMVEPHQFEEKAQNNMEAVSPDGNWVAFTKNFNIYLRSKKNDSVVALSADGSKHFEYGSWYGWYDKMEGENGSRPERFTAQWSEDSNYLITGVVDTRNAEKMYLLDWSIDSLYKPKLLSYYRGSPGDTNMVRIHPKIYDMRRKKEIKTQLPANTHINSVSLRWSETPGILYADYPERGYQTVRVLRYELPEGKATELLVERSKTNIDLFEYHILDKQNVMLFRSERSGWSQLYILDLDTKITTPLAPGEYFVNEIAHIDRVKGLVYFLASGREVGNNPYHQQLYRVDLKGRLKLLTPENTHHRVDINDEVGVFIDNLSTATTPTQTVLRSLKTGKILATISQANTTLLDKMGWKAPQVFQATGRDGETTIYGALWKPTNFDPDKVYPIIDHSYTGPHTQMFPKDFRRVLSLNNQALAELGFIVMMVDGMGSTGRSKAFRNVSYKNMDKNLTDHKLAIEQLGERYSWIDTSRVGIFGHSAGGYDAAHALLEFPEFYKVAVSSSADHDFRMEKAWWPEMYMGWPVDERYHEVSNVTMAPNLKGKLLLVHGGIDDNVNPSATFKLAEALVKADKQFDLMIFPSQRHGYSGLHGRYFLKMRWNYFVEHLLGAIPVWEFDWDSKD